MIGRGPTDWWSVAPVENRSTRLCPRIAHLARHQQRVFGKGREWLSLSRFDGIQCRLRDALDHSHDVPSFVVGFRNITRSSSNP